MKKSVYFRFKKAYNITVRFRKMEMTANSIKAECKTFPVSFYCKRKINVEFTEGATSCYFPIEDKIHVSVSQIMEAMKNAGDLDEETFKMLCRSNFYHEVSHAILTPRVMNPKECWRIDDLEYGDSKTGRAVLNIIEDERIETLLRKLYLNVDFKRSLIMMNGLDSYYGEPKDAVSFLYHVVRYRNAGSEQLQQMLEELIRDHRNLSSSSDYNEVSAYLHQVKKLWIAAKDEFNAKQKEKGEDEKKSQDSDLKSNGSDEQANAPQTGQGSQNASQGKGDEKQDSDGKADKSDSDQSQEEREIEEVLKKIESKVEGGSAGLGSSEVASELLSRNPLEDGALYEQLKRIIVSSKLSAKRNAAATNGYSGVIDPRLTDRKDCKFFVQKCRGGHYKQNSKVHLTFYQDVSGSYWEDGLPTNQLFYALSKVERECPDFSFDVVEVSNGIRVLPKDKRMISPAGGTCLDSSIHQTVKKMSKPDAVNKAIVLFDGACSQNYNFKAFNSKDTTFIYEEENAYAVEQYCPACVKRQIEGEFSKELKKVAVEMIERML